MDDDKCQEFSRNDSRILLNPPRGHTQDIPTEIEPGQNTGKEIKIKEKEKSSKGPCGSQRQGVCTELTEGASQTRVLTKIPPRNRGRESFRQTDERVCLADSHCRRFSRTHLRPSRAVPGGRSEVPEGIRNKKVVGMGSHLNEHCLSVTIVALLMCVSLNIRQNPIHLTGNKE